MFSDNDLLAELSKYIEKSKGLETYCNENGFMYFDTSTNLEKRINEIVASLIE